MPGAAGARSAWRTEVQASPAIESAAACARETSSGSRSGPSQLAAFMEERGFSDYAELWRWSVEDLEGFWGALWERFELGPARHACWVVARCPALSGSRARG